MAKKIKRSKKSVKQKQKQSQTVNVHIHSTPRAKRVYKPAQKPNNGTYIFRTNDPVVPFSFNASTPAAVALTKAHFPAIHMDTQTDLPLPARVTMGTQAGSGSLFEAVSGLPFKAAPAVSLTQPDDDDLVDDLRQRWDEALRLDKIWIRLDHGSYKLKPDVPIPDGKFFNTKTGRFNKIPEDKKASSKKAPFK